MAKRLPLNIEVINGEVQEKPVLFYFNTEIIKPIGLTIIRWFDENMCSLARKIFIIQYEDNLFGTSQFKTMADFWQWLGYNLRGGTLLLNGCKMLLNNKNG